MLLEVLTTTQLGESSDDKMADLAELGVAGD